MGGMEGGRRRTGKAAGGEGEREGNQDPPVAVDSPSDHPAAAGETKWSLHTLPQALDPISVPSATFASHDMSNQVSAYSALCLEFQNVDLAMLLSSTKLVRWGKFTLQATSIYDTSDAADSKMLPVKAL